MQNTKPIIPELTLLRKQKGGICITLVIPLNLSQPTVTRNTIQKLVRRIKQSLRNSYQAQEINTLMVKLDELTASIDLKTGAQGVGVYLSTTVSLCVYFPFPVQERVMTSDRFDLRELMYKEDFANPYCVLLLTEQHARMFTGMWNNLIEIKDGHFPLVNTAEYIYSKPARSSSNAGSAHVKDFEKDKSIMGSIRTQEFFRLVDKGLDPYLISQRPLIVLAVKKELSLFTDVSHHRAGIIGKAEGNYDRSNEQELADIAWPLMHAHLEQQHLSLLKELNEKAGVGKSIPGMQHIWTAAREGKGLKLLVEKDYRQPGFLSENDYHLYLHPPKRTSRILSDAVEDVIETVLEKNGEVYFFENGTLKQYEHIAMIARY